MVLLIHQNFHKMGTSIHILLLLILTLSSLLLTSAAVHEKKNPSAMVVGTVYCDTCFHQEFTKTSHFMSGASVAVECGNGKTKSSYFRKEVKTNKHGVFRVQLPSEVSKHIRRIKACSVKLVSSNEPFCAVASSATSSSLSLKSRKQGIHIFSAGFFSFKPLNQPELCYQKPGITGTSTFSSSKDLRSPFAGLPALNLPPLTQLPALPGLSNLPPLPQLPALPGLPNLPSPPNLGQPSQPKPSESTNQAAFPSQPIPFIPSPPVIGGVPLPPNPFQPPSILPPNPLQPPPSILPPLPFQPTPPPFISLPPNPFLTPPSPPPFFRFPPFPFPPSPFFPGIPPSLTAKKKDP